MTRASGDAGAVFSEVGFGAPWSEEGDEPGASEFFRRAITRIAMAAIMSAMAGFMVAILGGDTWWGAGTESGSFRLPLIGDDGVSR